MDLQDRLEALLEGLTVVALADEIVARAVRVGSSTLRTLDAIHLATGLALGPDLTALVTYDAGQADAARALGIAVATPAWTLRLALALGYEVRAVTPYLAVKGAAGAIDWYREIFGADEVSRWHDPAQAAKVTDPFGHVWLVPRVVA